MQNDLDKMEGVFLKRGDYTFALDNDKKWDFKPLAKAGDTVSRARIPPPNFLGHGQGRKDVAAGAPGGQEDFVHESAVLEKFMSRPTQSMVASRLLPP